MKLKRQPEKSPTTTARFRQRCSACGHPMEIGTQITHDAQRGWRHEKCPRRTRPRPRDRRPTCPVCGYPIERGEDVAATERDGYAHLICARPDLGWAVAEARRNRLGKGQQ
jgi:hypothetical protein